MNDERAITGERDIILHLEKRFSLARLAAAKKKPFNTALVHCQRVLEPIFSQLLDNFDISLPVGQVLKNLTQELTLLDSNLKSPYYFGQQLTWVGIPSPSF